MGFAFWMIFLLALPLLHSANILTVCLTGEYNFKISLNNFVSLSNLLISR